MKIRWLFIILVLFISGLSLIKCGSKELQNPNILAGQLNFELPDNAQKLFNSILSDTELKKIFKKNVINNIYYSKYLWTGSIKVNNASFQSIFTINDFITTWEGEIIDAQGLVFSIFQPDGSDLNYKVYLEWYGNKKKIFSKRFNKKIFFDVHLPFKEKIKGKVKLIFETSGKGIGAWISPRFDRRRTKSNLVIVLVMDTLRYDHTSLYGYSRETTPNLEKLAKDGVKFQNAYSTSSWTLPAHVSLFSGKNLTEHGVVGPRNSIPESFPMLAEVFQNQGFVTAAFTGGGFIEDSYGFSRGFQYYSNQPGNVFSINSAERVFTHFKEYIKRYKNNDRFIFLHTYQIHAPYKAPGKYVKKINPDNNKNLLGISNFLKDKREYFQSISKDNRQLLIDLYDASVLYTDEALLGKIIDFLKKQGEYENSMLVVLSDHGEEFFDHGSWEHGHTLYNELVKIPLVIKFPEFSSKKPGVFNPVTSISDVPGLVLENYGFLTRTLKKEFLMKSGRSDRFLPVLFPVSPTIKAFPTKISFIDANYTFIFNQINKKQLEYFIPPLSGKITSYELYRQSDVKQINNVFNQNSFLLEGYRGKIRTYLEKLKKIKKNKGNLDSDLQNKLRSLGYLN